MKKMLILAILVSLLAVSAVSAADNATDDIDVDVNDEIGIVENQQLEQKDNDENVGVGTDSEILSEDIGNFSGLADEIQNGGNIELKHKYYKYDSGYNTIKITVNNSVIDGKGAVIDWVGLGNPLYVYASGVIIKNLTFKNADMRSYYYVIDYGYSSSNFILENCNFINNTAPEGLINRGYTVKNCNFIDNSVGSYGFTFICSNTVTNCNFINNSGSRYVCSSETVTNCNFINNSVGYDIIDSKTVSNCNFINNSGSAISCYGSVINCSFVNNSAIQGGAIRGSGSVINCSFVKRKINIA